VRLLLVDLDKHFADSRFSFISSHFFCGVTLDVINTKDDLSQLHFLSL